MFYKVITSSKSRGIGNGLTYEAPEDSIKPGMPVRVPLRSKLVEGIVVGVIKERAKEEYDLKQIKEILGEEPLVSDAALKTAQWMAEYYLCSLRQTLSVWLPSPPWSGVLPKEIVGYRLKKLNASNLRGKKQQAVAQHLLGKEWVSKTDLVQEIGVSPTTLLTLKKNGVIEEERQKEERQPSPSSSPLLSLPVLTPAQEAACELIKGDARPALLFGITASGKTEIYARLIADAVSQDKQAILLLPEILLTEHFIHRFERLLRSDAIAVVHSKITGAARRTLWQRIHRGEISLVIGSRSALFAPLRKLSLVILDEEHEWTYKNEQTPRYHARETAEKLCTFAGAKLVLGSATPSVESWAHAKSGHYNLVRLPVRYQDHPLPTVRIVDLAQVQFGSLYPFSPVLIQAIRERLDRKEQAVLFLNRRGVASALLCLQCRRRVICPDSQLPYTLHHTASGRPYLLDHTTGIAADVPAHCPHCQSTRLQPIGAGTQRIELLLKSIFPSARLLRADSDSIRYPEEMRTLLRKMRQREADILLGTQSVVKGLDLPEVTLAAVVIADIGLSLPHFRAGERIFQLLTQLTGRSGRAKPGEVIIQTYRPDAPEVVAASRHETEKYLDDELKVRLYSSYPPATRMIRLVVRDDAGGRKAKRIYAEALRANTALKGDTKVTVAPTLFGGGKTWHLLLRGASPQALLTELDVTDATVDVDPVETI